MDLRPLHTTVNGITLRGSHYLPAGARPLGTAVLFHGFGGSRVETTGVFVTLARALAAAGIAVVAYDRAGHGESDGDFLTTTASGDITQAHQVLEAITRLEGVDAEGLHLVGMSLGAVIASVVAAESAFPIRSLTMWSTAAVFTDDIKSGRLQGKSLDSLDTDGYFDFLGMRLGPAMREDAMTFDVYGRAAAYRNPALLLHGSADFVPVSYADRYLDEEVFGVRAELQVVAGADHGWAQLPQRDLLIARTTDFILSNTHGKKP
ncbi:alpha/beta hydrolase family protein [Arthrobacter sp. RAF14]|uniref:alpha/beta hydrolase family protein n=1 Tax=Arthrobacter sp. RAF14 TaxID=3233051 RepID=UPI003F904DB1